MWHFAIGLYLVELTPESLRLTAIYQLVSTLSIIIFGPLVGDWVDANPRLKGTKTALSGSLFVCLFILFFYLSFTMKFVRVKQQSKAPIIIVEESVSITRPAHSP